LGWREWDGRGLTDERDDDDNEVEDIPRLLEVVPAQSDQLHDAFDREDTDERQVHKLERVVERLGHLVVLERHGDHVEQNDRHDAAFKPLVCHQFEEETLKLELSTHNQHSRHG